jgi:peptide/nickel transport system permease protein
MENHHVSYAQKIRKQFLTHKLGTVASFVVLLFCVLGVYAPFFASSKPLIVVYNKDVYFPLFKYFFYTGFYTKRIDIFFNLLIFTIPAFLLTFWFVPKGKIQKNLLLLIVVAQLSLFTFYGYFNLKDPASSAKLNQERYAALEQKRKQGERFTWEDELKYLNSYGKLNLVLDYRNRFENHERLQKYSEAYQKGALDKWLNDQTRIKRLEIIKGGMPEYENLTDDQLKTKIKANTVQEKTNEILSMPTLWQMDQVNEQRQISLQQEIIDECEKKEIIDQNICDRARATIQYRENRHQWLESQNNDISFILMPLFRTYHWEDDAGGEQALNKYIPWWELTRINRKDLMAGLIFGVRISLVVGILSVALAMLIGIPIGVWAGYYGGKFDILVSRLLEIWESMPTFFMLLLVVAMTQSKSIFLVIAVVGFFGWTGFSRFLRGEFFKQRNLPYVEACRALGFRDSHIMFSHILPNAIPPVITLLPFAIMGAISSEAGLSFLGLGEEGSCSWGVLMDEGRTAFPAESYLLWPPAILLTILLVAIALVGDALRDAIDPKLS